MSRPVDRGKPRGKPWREAEAGREARFTHFLRQSHIFSAVVREVLEVNLLREAGALGLTVSQLHLLRLMCLDGPHQIGAVAALLGVSAPAATKNIDKLERMGLVVRSRSEGDRRARPLKVSAKGRRLVERQERLKAGRLAAVLAEFRAEEIEAFFAMLERFSLSLLNQNRGDGEFCLRCAGYIDEDCPVGQRLGGCPYRELGRTGASAESAKEAL